MILPHREMRGSPGKFYIALESPSKVIQKSSGFLSRLLFASGAGFGWPRLRRGVPLPASRMRYQARFPRFITQLRFPSGRRRYFHAGLRRCRTAPRSKSRLTTINMPCLCITPPVPVPAGDKSVRRSRPARLRTRERAPVARCPFATLVSPYSVVLPRSSPSGRPSRTDRLRCGTLRPG